MLKRMLEECQKYSYDCLGIYWEIKKPMDSSNNDLQIYERALTVFLVTTTNTNIWIFVERSEIYF